jgi:predicted patatin/cPLA2 family phospholipase
MRSLLPRNRAGRIALSLALQGGGAHGAFTWGALDRLLEEETLDIKAVSGTSAAGFTHQLSQLLIADRAGRFPLGATGDERHDRGFGIMLHGA